MKLPNFRHSFTNVHPRSDTLRKNRALSLLITKFSKRTIFFMRQVHCARALLSRFCNLCFQANRSGPCSSTSRRDKIVPCTVQNCTVGIQSSRNRAVKTIFLCIRRSEVKSRLRLCRRLSLEVAPLELFRWWSGFSAVSFRDGLSRLGTSLENRTLNFEREKYKIEIISCFFQSSSRNSSHHLLEIDIYKNFVEATSKHRFIDISKNIAKVGNKIQH